MSKLDLATLTIVNGPFGFVATEKHNPKQKYSLQNLLKVRLGLGLHN